MLHRIILGAASVAFAFMALIGGADAAPPAKAPAKKPVVVSQAKAPEMAVNDQAFVTKATYGTNTEIEMSNMILRQAISEKLRAFGQKMLQDHTMLKNELTKVANGAHFKIPSGIEPNMVKTRDRLAKMSGLAFDKAMWPLLVKGHQMAVALFKSEVANGHNKELVAWARQRLPLLEKHLRMAEMECGLKAAATKAPSKSTHH